MAYQGPENSPIQEDVNFKDVSETLYGYFESLYFVNLSDGTYSKYNAENRPGISAPVLTGEDFFGTTQDNIPVFVHQEDVSIVKAFFRRELLLQCLEADPAPEVSFRMHKDNDVLWYRARCSFSGPRKDRMIVAVENTDNEQRHSQEHYAVISSLSRNYLSVFSVDLRSDRATDYIRRIALPEHEEEISAFFTADTMSKRIQLIADKWVCPPDREKFLQTMQMNNILAALEKDPVFNVPYRVIHDGEYHFYKCKFVREKGSPYITVGIRNRDNDEYQELCHRRELLDAKLRTEKIVEEQTEELRRKNVSLRKMNESVVELLGSVVEGRDIDSGEHIRRVKGFTYILANQVMQDLPEYGLTERKVNLMVYASALHDVGKIAIPDSILLKPGLLNEEEFEIMKTHCERGCDILRKMVGYWNREYLDMDMDICLYHHEKWDGKGYPRGLKGDEIPISAQIVSIADIYDALTSVRCYKRAYSYHTAARMILSGECGAFSDKMLSCFSKCQLFFEKHAMDPTSMIQTNIPTDETIAYVPSYEAAVENLRVHRPGTTSGDHIPEYRRGGCFDGMRILLVDDSSLSLAVNREVLDDEGAVTDIARSGAEALELLTEKRFPYDAVLVDIDMPDMDGVRTTARIREKAHNQGFHLPVIAMTADGSDDDILEMLKAGADDCIGKPVSANELSKALLTCLRERSARVEKRLENTIRIAETDALTHVKSITAYTDKVADLSARISAGEKVEFGVVMCDLNNLKEENDSFGHDSGDQYIVNCCQILCHVFDHSPVYRIGGDEFVAILQGSDLKNARELMTELRRKAAEAETKLNTRDGKTSFASGIAFYNPALDLFVSDTVKRADRDMYVLKRRMKEGSVRSAPRE